MEFSLKSLCFLFLLFGVSLAQSNSIFGIFDLGPAETDEGNQLEAVGGAATKKSNDFVTGYKGDWEVHCQNSGVSAMHLVIFPNNKAIMFDATVFGPSEIKLPAGVCVRIPWSKTNEVDCYAHAVEYDIETADIRPLKVLSNTWCSSGGLAADGTLVQTGGWNEGGRVVRFLKGCDNCDWQEHPDALSGQRWYSTQQILPDGNFILVGGRRMFNVEFVPSTAAGLTTPVNFQLPLLRETTDQEENNLYPFVHLSTDGNVFIFANSRSILFSPKTKTVIREFPVLPGGSRNYPPSAMSALLPIKLHGENAAVIPAEVLICGGNVPQASKLAERKNFLPALTSCGRIQITKEKAAWKMETMPSGRVMGDMIILPTGDILMLNGAQKGVSGWQFADAPNYNPVLYKPMNYKTDRFFVLKQTNIARMYHSTAALLPDGKILVAGSNTNNAYNFTGPDVIYPTEMRVEKFSPPYLDPMLAIHRPIIDDGVLETELQYGKQFTLQIKLAEFAGILDRTDLKVSIYAPPFTTHGYSMGQRLVLLATSQAQVVFPGVFRFEALAPPSSTIAPAGYYMLHVVYRGVPSKAVWVHVS